VIGEPLGGAHRDADASIKAVGDAIQTMLNELSGQSREKLVKDRRQKFLDMGSKGLAA
jgi:acetyl-CoA carboxylase carboxyl transferase subunit alpha